MDAQTYYLEAQRTATHPNPALQQLARFHWVEGLMDELGELIVADVKRDTRAVKDEAGDFLWYLANLSRAHDLPFVTLLNKAMAGGWNFSLGDGLQGASRGEELTIALSFFIGKLKRRDFYTNKEVSQNELSGLLWGVLCVLKRLLSRYRLTFEGVMQFNIDKLQVRYPLEFNG